MAKELATQLIEQLQAAGVQRIYGIVGDSLNPIVDAVRQTGGSTKGGIDWIHVRHEEAAAFAAAAEAQLTGQARRLRRFLRPRQPAPDQWAV